MTEGAAPQQGVRSAGTGSGGFNGLRGFSGNLAGYLTRQWRVLRSATETSLEQRRQFVLLPFALIAGIVIYRLLDHEPGFPVFIAATLGLLFALLMLRWPRWSPLCLAIWAGFCALPVHGALNGTQLLAAPKYGQYEMRIDAVLFNDGENQRWLVSGIRAADPRDDPDVRRARLAAPGGHAVQPGDRLDARVRFYPIPAPVLPGAFDAQFSGYFDGIGAYGSVLGEPVIASGDDGGFFRITESIRHAIAARILTVLEPPAAGIAIALVTGDQSRLDEDERELMASVGLAHVLAISGLHLTLAAGTAFFVLRAAMSLSYRLPQRLAIKRAAAAGGIAVAICYLVISGMGIAATRATVMLTLIFAAIFFGRQALTMRNVALAGLVIALMDPASVFRASFQLSFAAVVALIGAFELARENRDRKERSTNPALRLFIDIAMTSVIAGFATLFFTAYHFQQTAPFGLLGNLLAMPIVTFIMMPSALFATLLIPSGLDGPFFLIMGWSIEAMLWCAQFVRAISGGFDPSPILAPSALVICLAALGWMAFYQSRIRLVGPILAVPIIFVFCTEPPPDIMIADTTQALAVRNEGRLALISGRLNTFATNVWSERYMEEILSQHEATGCDSLGCILKSTQGFTIALARDPSVFAEDCSVADIVVTRMNAPSWCRSNALVIDAQALTQRGAHAIYWNTTTRQFRVNTAITDTDRPWRIHSGE